MLVLFTEQDLVSFGTFMLSEARQKPYTENEITKQDLPKYLSQVNKFDLESWYRIRQSEEAAAYEASKPKVSQDVSKSSEEINTVETEEIPS